MKNLIIFASILILCSFFSCENKEKEGPKEEKIFYENHEIPINYVLVGSTTENDDVPLFLYGKDTTYTVTTHVISQNEFEKIKDIIEEVRRKNNNCYFMIKIKLEKTKLRSGTVVLVSETSELSYFKDNEEVFVHRKVWRQKTDGTGWIITQRH